MKRTLSVMFRITGLVFALGVWAEEGKMAAKAAPKTVTVKGELVDMGCYVAHGAKGEKHKECATKCIAGGMPMGLLTDKGKLYLLTLNHDNADPYNKAKEMAAAMVEVTGQVSTRNGVSAIDVTDIKAASAPAAK